MYAHGGAVLSGCLAQESSPGRGVVSYQSPCYSALIHVVRRFVLGGDSRRCNHRAHR